MPATLAHQGPQRQSQREQSLLRPARDPEADLQAALHEQRLVGNRALGGFRTLHAPDGSGTPTGHRAPVQHFVQRALQRLARPAAPVVQAKLVLGPANDAYEQEADQIAGQVAQRLATGSVQRTSESDEEEDEQEEAVQTARGAAPAGALGGALDAGTESAIHGARGGGSPLPDHVRSPMEASFGADFGGVRVHTGGQSDTLNRQLQARAFTTGSDIFFRSGEYNPGTGAGQRLLAHELTHVVQQGAAPAPVRRSLWVQRAWQPLFFRPV
jgi:hypothetical protein